MIKELCCDNAILGVPCRPATAEDAQIAADLLETMESMDDVACLAANQIGETVSIIAFYDDNEEAHVWYNPKMLRMLGAVKILEGCLSHEEEQKVTRYARITVAYEELVDGALVSRRKEMRDWEAQLVQHMIDHCKGKLI